MDGLVEFKTDDGALIVVEGADDESGARLVSRGDGQPGQAARTFEGALGSVQAAAQSALRVFRDGSLKPDAVELEFGVKLSAEAGAVIAKGSTEGHLVVRLTWSPGQGTAGPSTPSDPSGSTGPSGQAPSGPGAADAS